MAAPTIRTVSPSTVLKNFPAGISSGKNRSWMIISRERFSLVSLSG